MTLVLIFVAGAIVGWLVSKTIAVRPGQDPYFDIALGMLGAIGASVLVTPLIGGASLTGKSLNALALLAAVLGALMLLGVVNVVRRDARN